MTNDSRMRMPLRERIEQYTSIDPQTGCWEWLASATVSGYGRIMMTREAKVHRSSLAHRVAYEEYVGPIPDGLVLDHLCRNTICCNPEHLEPVTQAENVRRGEAPSNTYREATHCIHGHEFTEENTYRTERGRYCRACRRRRNAESNARKKASA